MSQKYFQQGSIFTPADSRSFNYHDELPSGNYTVKTNPMTGAFYFEMVESFVLDHKIYGSVPSRCERIISTFESRPSATGVLLVGEKGSGKTLSAKLISVLAAQKDIPTILINQAFCGDGFNSFIQGINQACVILFDEFEKVYDSDDQEKILTLLDGVYPSKKLFVLTCNNRGRLDQHLNNRPGRIFYSIDFKGLEEDEIRGYCQDMLDNKVYIDKIVELKSYIYNMNFDILKALVEEMNRYLESPMKALQMLNARPNNDSPVYYSMKASINGVECKTARDQWRGNPLLSHELQVNIEVGRDEDDDEIWRTYKFGSTDLIHTERHGDRYVFVNDAKVQVIFDRIYEKSNHFLEIF